MSGLIHITHKTPAWQKTLRMACGLTLVVGGFAWYVLSDDGLPMTAPQADAKAPFVKAKPLPAPPPTAMAPEQANEDDAQATGRLAKAAAALGTDTRADDDYATRNASIDVHRLTLLRPQTARSFLSEVLLTQNSPSGFVVTEVLPESRYERMGLKPGDVIYSLDTPGAPNVDENSMVALIQQTDLSLEVYRNGTLTRLHTNLAKLEDGNVGSKP